MSSEVKVVHTKADFLQCLKDNPKVVCDFYADWCGPCRMIAPKYIELSKLYPDICFLKVNVDENSEAAEHCKISCMPTFLLFHNGDQFNRLEGASEANLRELLEKLKNL